MPDSSSLSSFLLLPGCCLLCGARSGREQDMCTPCLTALPRVTHACLRCAIPLPANAVCGACLRQSPPQDASRAPFRYAFPLDALIPRFKFDGDHAAGRVLGELFAASLPVQDGKPDCLLPVPLHPQRLRERGFNQAELLAGEIARRHGIPVRTDLLERRRATAVQSGMRAAVRRQNMRGAFAVTTTPPAHVVVVDDVMTTGSTVAEIARALKRAGAIHVDVWTLARTA